MPAHRPISIAIVEDLKDVAIELSHIVNEEEDLSCDQVYHNAEEAITFLQRNPVEAIIQLKELIPDTEFCMFTVFEDADRIFDSIKAGAKGYILKNDDPDTIVSSLRDLSKGGSPMNPIIARKVIDSFTRSQSKGKAINIDLPLTPREKEILGLLSKGLLYKEIAQQLGITTGTVKQHIHKIYDKLQVNNKTEAINMYLRRG
jgi:DNA-binding NarL/FixJ family response regulator